jgi:ABC-type multidrug transport system ATPase subunit
MSPALEVQRLYKRYGSVVALEALDLAVAPGEAVALLGPNGSGKTTLLRCVAGLIRASSGSVSICGEPLGRGGRAARRHLAFVPQQATFPRQATVREVLALHARIRGVPTERAAAVLGEADLAPELAGRSVATLSGGMCQRLSLAVAQLADTKLMLLDEPTANLDPEATVHFREAAKRWRAQGRALLIATHVLDDAAELADRVVVLLAGKKAGDESIGALRDRLHNRARMRVVVERPTQAHVAAALASGATQASTNSHSLLITAPASRRQAILMRLSELGPVEHFETEGPSLEAIYLEYVHGGPIAQP